MSVKMKNKKKSRKISRPSERRSVNLKKNKFTKKELNDFKKLILNKKEEILEGIKHISEDTLKKSQKEAAGDISSYTYHMADVATDTYDREFSLGLASTGREALYELDDAMKKIEDGIFGICEECKGGIAKNRLKVVPHARFCVKCQEKKERR